jgi:hypothetical protein
MTKDSNRGHLTPEQIEGMLRSITSLLPQFRHILVCKICLTEFTAALLETSEELPPLVWRSQGLSTRTANALASAGVFSRRELEGKEPDSIPGIGQRGADEIRKMLAQPPLLP